MELKFSNVVNAGIISTVASIALTAFFTGPGDTSAVHVQHLIQAALHFVQALFNGSSR